MYSYLDKLSSSTHIVRTFSVIWHSRVFEHICILSYEHYDLWWVHRIENYIKMYLIEYNLAFQSLIVIEISELLGFKVKSFLKLLE